MKKTIYILFGEMGSGKNYRGERLAESLGVPFFDGDEVISDEMRRCVEKFKPMNSEMIQAYMDILEVEIVRRAEATEGDLVVAQALYSDMNRKNLFMALRNWNYSVQPIWVRVSMKDNAKYLMNRPQGWRWVMYWLMNKPFFEKPTHGFTRNIYDHP